VQKIRLDKFSTIFVVLFLISVIFPYVTLIRLGSDIQPYSLLLGVGVLLVLGFYRSVESYLSIILLFITILIFCFSPVVFSSVRGMASILLFCVVYMALTSVVQAVHVDKIKSILWLGLILYLLAALIQSVFGPNSLIFLSPRYFSYGGFLGRGVDSLTAEPTFYGFTVLLLSMAYLNFSRRWSWDSVAFWSVSFFQIIFLAKSSSATLTFLVVAFCYLFLFSRLSYWLVPIVGCISLVLYFLILNIVDVDSRLYSVLISVNDPMSFFRDDLSANDRFYNVYYSYKGAFDSLFFPNGFSNWYSYLMEASKYNTDVTNVTGEDERILSLFGGLLYELGFFSILFFYLYFRSVRGIGVRNDFGTIVLIAFFSVFFFSQAIPVSHPVFALFLVSAAKSLVKRVEVK
jgi:hypothetical protein